MQALDICFNAILVISAFVVLFKSDIAMNKMTKDTCNYVRIFYIAISIASVVTLWEIMLGNSTNWITALMLNSLAVYLLFDRRKNEDNSKKGSIQQHKHNGKIAH